jgi:sulfur carrier protein
VLERLQRIGLDRGLWRGASRAWLVVGTLAWLLRTARRVSRPVPEVVYRQVLDPGDRILVEHTLHDRTGRTVRRRCGRDRPGGRGPRPARHDGGVKVLLRNPRRELEVDGPISVVALLNRLEIHRDTVLVIRGDELVPGDALLGDHDEIEIRPVISGGADGGTSP